jgi:hypothetical protein
MVILIVQSCLWHQPHYRAPSPGLILREVAIGLGVQVRRPAIPTSTSLTHVWTELHLRYELFRLQNLSLSAQSPNSMTPALSSAKNASLLGNSPATTWYHFHLYTAQSPLRMVYWTSYASFDPTDLPPTDQQKNRTGATIFPNW